MRKSFHFMPFSVLAVLAARYLAPHSALLRPLPALAVAAALVVAAAAASVVAALVLSALAGVASVAAATVPHSALRNWFQFCPPSVPASFAALYLVLHSAMVSALAGAARNKVTTARPVKVASRWMSMRFLPLDVHDMSHASNSTQRQVAPDAKWKKSRRKRIASNEILKSLPATLQAHLHGKRV
jgi:hypothetical protein